MSRVVMRDDVFDWSCDDEQAERVRAGILRGERVHEARVEARPHWYWLPMPHQTEAQG